MLQYLPSLEISEVQALWWLAVSLSSNALMEKLVHRFCHQATSFNQLEWWNWWFNPSYHWQAYKNGILQASQGNYQCPRPSWGHYRGSNAAPWPFRLNYQWLRLGFHLEILIIAMLLPWDQAKALYYFLPSNWWPAKIEWERPISESLLISNKMIGLNFY